MLKQYALRPLTIAALMTAAFFTAGCASNNPPSESSLRSSTLNDAQEHARGGRDRNHTPSQWAFGFGDKKGANTNGIASGQVRELLETRTFLGTIACPPANDTCEPVRLVTTMSPDGVWRMRAALIGQNDTPAVSQGCWHQIGDNPTRILLQTQNDTVFADLSFMHDQQLRVNVFNYVRPTLETHLSRQPEVDPISELENQIGPECRR